ncbi:hypothetical protein ACFL52_04300 [Candidatus Margulisiibacteriota bacterium]
MLLGLGRYRERPQQPQHSLQKKLVVDSLVTFLGKVTGCLKGRIAGSWVYLIIKDLILDQEEIVKPATVSLPHDYAAITTVGSENQSGEKSPRIFFVSKEKTEAALAILQIVRDKMYDCIKDELPDIAIVVESTISKIALVAIMPFFYERLERNDQGIEEALDFLKSKKGEDSDYSDPRLMILFCQRDSIFYVQLTAEVSEKRGSQIWHMKN